MDPGLLPHDINCRSFHQQSGCVRLIKSTQVSCQPRLTKTPQKPPGHRQAAPQGQTPWQGAGQGPGRKEELNFQSFAIISSWGVEGLTPGSGKPLTIVLSKSHPKNPLWIASTSVPSPRTELSSLPSPWLHGFTQAPSSSAPALFPSPGMCCLLQLLCQLSKGRSPGLPGGMNGQRTGSGASPALPWVQLGTRNHPKGIGRDGLTTERQTQSQGRGRGAWNKPGAMESCS